MRQERWASPDRKASLGGTRDQNEIPACTPGHATSCLFRP